MKGILKLSPGLACLAYLPNLSIIAMVCCPIVKKDIKNSTIKSKKRHGPSKDNIPNV